jgi:hypothetical protein
VAVHDVRFASRWLMALVALILGLSGVASAVVPAAASEPATGDADAAATGDPGDLAASADDGDSGNGHHDEEQTGAHDGNHTPRRWSDPASWPDGRLPASDADVVVDGHVVLDRNADVAALTVTSGSTLEFASDASVTLQSSGNVVVQGTLLMQPSRFGIDHLLRFVEVDETRFVGGGHTVLETDTGLWFTGHGHAMLKGSERLPWTRAAHSLAKDSTTLELEDVPSGWQVGDEIVITPTSPPGTDGHSDGYSEGRVAALDGRKVTLDTPLAYAHPRVNSEWGAEVMNMTRNVRIEGTPDGRSHVQFSHVHRAQHLHNVALRHMGPRQDTGASYRLNRQVVAITEGVKGRYPLHFHHSFDGTVGSMVENVVVRDSGFRAFVPHASNGITFQGTIAHDVFDEAYWWDKAEGGVCCGSNWIHSPPSNDITYDRAVASLIRTDPPHRGFTLAGFELGHGSNTAVTDSVAVGVQGNRDSSGFKWPGGVRDVDGHWHFQGNVSHNNKMHGIFVWDNTQDRRHLIADSFLYHNGMEGIFHGAYHNHYRYENVYLHGNGRSGVDLHAQGDVDFADMTFAGDGRSSYGFSTGRHRLEVAGATLSNPTFVGYTDRAVAFLSSDVGYLDIVNPSFDQPEETWFYLSDDVSRRSIYRVQLPDGTAWRLHPKSSSIGEYVGAWNARREAIPAFR